jgi:hypothetical protein
VIQVKTGAKIKPADGPQNSEDEGSSQPILF